MKVYKLTYIPLLFATLGVASCGPKAQDQANQYELPDLYNMTLSDAKLSVGANVFFEPHEVRTQELVEGRILGYHNKKVGDVVAKGQTIMVDVAKRVDSAKSYSSGPIKYSSSLYKLTGPDSVNEDVCLQHAAGGTDLGIPFELPDGRMMLLYGDTFAGQNMSGLWNSNYMAITSDKVLWDGLTFDDIVHNDDNDILIPFAQGAHQKGNQSDKNVEVTKIPTGGISIGNNVYIFYMSIRYWGVGGSWTVTYNQCVKANDNTYKSWSNVSSLRWDEDELYYAGQVYPFKDPKDSEHIYFTSIPGGRNDGAVMFRVATDKFEDRNEYEYLTAKDTWTKGDTGMKKLNDNPYYILSPGVSEPSIMYSSYLNKYIYSTLKGTAISFIMADNVTGPYKENYVICDSSDYSGLYGGFLHANFSDSEGQRVYLQLSRWTPIYNTQVLEVVFK